MWLVQMWTKGKQSFVAPTNNYKFDYRSYEGMDSCRHLNTTLFVLNKTGII